MRFTNRLLQNPPDAACLEITLVGPTITTDQPVGLAVFGANFQMTIDGESREMGTFTLYPNQTLSINGCTRGCRGYVAVCGGLRTETILNSRTSFELLQANTILRCEPSTVRGRTLPASDMDGIWNEFLNLPSPARGTIRALAGTQADWFDETFWSREYQVSPASNRMGLRLLGEPISKPNREMVSEAVAPGAVQITNDGRPIVLGVDGQTIGGYPKVAHVITADLPRLGQCRPNQHIRFINVTMDDVRTINQTATTNWNALEAYLAKALVS